jgi:hypothetical protein
VRKAHVELFALPPALSIRSIRSSTRSIRSSTRSSIRSIRSSTRSIRSSTRSSIRSIRSSIRSIRSIRSSIRSILQLSVRGLAPCVGAGGGDCCAWPLITGVCFLVEVEHPLGTVCRKLSQFALHIHGLDEPARTRCELIGVFLDGLYFHKAEHGAGRELERIPSRATRVVTVGADDDFAIEGARLALLPRGLVTFAGAHV